MHSNKLVLSSVNSNIFILKSDEHFESWFLKQYDMSMYDEESVRLLLEEEKPAIYPCIPVISDDRFSTTYVELSLVEFWCKEMNIQRK